MANGIPRMANFRYVADVFGVRACYRVCKALVGGNFDEYAMATALQLGNTSIILCSWPGPPGKVCPSFCSTRYA